jgi:hypothetical protein
MRYSSCDYGITGLNNRTNVIINGPLKESRNQIVIRNRKKEEDKKHPSVIIGNQIIDHEACN